MLFQGVCSSDPAVASFQPSHSTGAPMTELPGKARPWFVSTQAEDIPRDQPPATGASVCSKQGCTLLRAYKNTSDIAEQCATVLHPGDLSNRPLLPPSDSGGTSEGAPAVADPGACLSQDSLCDCPAGARLVMSPLLEWALLHWKSGRMGQALGSFDCAVSAGAAPPEHDGFQQPNCSGTGGDRKMSLASHKAVPSPGECKEMV